MKYLLNILAIVSSALCADERILPLGNLGSVRYTYDDLHLNQVDRLSPSGKILYTHSYSWDHEGHLISESLIGDLGTAEYEDDFIIKSLYNTEICDFDENQNLVAYFTDNEERKYEYTEKNELILEKVDVPCTYDENGYLVQKGDTLFEYDEEGHLTAVFANGHFITYTYDCSGNRTSRTVNGSTESYIYFDSNEIAVLDEEERVKELRIPGLSPHRNILRPIAIETKDAIYAPIHNVQGNIVKLINIATKAVINLEKTDPFGKGLSKNAPTAWVFAGKHYDKEAGLVYFGDRYYCPEIHQWTTPDPDHQTDDPYQYCLNNPISYIDPDGRFAIPLVGLAWGAGVTITAPVWAPYAAAAAGGALIGYGVYEGIQYVKGLDRHQTSQDYWNGDQIIWKMERSKKGGIDPSLPTNPENDKNWEDISHPKEKNAGHTTFRNKKTGEEIRLDKGTSEKTGHGAHDHYHRLNPNSIDRHDEYLDKDFNPVGRNSEESHLYPPEWVWWK